MSNQLKSLRLLPDGGGAIIFEGFVPFPKAMVEASVPMATKSPAGGAVPL